VALSFSVKLSLVAIIVAGARLHSNPGSEPLFSRPLQSPRTTKARPGWHGSPPTPPRFTSAFERRSEQWAALLLLSTGQSVVICFTDACRSMPLAFRCWTRTRSLGRSH
jgi:hypothetical protein